MRLRLFAEVRIAYGLYRVRGFVNAWLAAQTGPRIGRLMVGTPGSISVSAQARRLRR
jgi:hypothetical protein